MAKLLDTVGDGANEQVSAKPRWLAAIESPPLFAQFIRSERGKRFKNPRHLCVANRPICFDHGDQTAFKMRYRRGFSSGFSDTRVRPSFFLTASARNPRTLCCCQPVAACSSSIVAPSCRLSRSRQVCCFVCLRVAGLVLLRVPTTRVLRVCRFGAFALSLLFFALNRRRRLGRAAASVPASSPGCDLAIGWSSI